MALDLVLNDNETEEIQEAYQLEDKCHRSMAGLMAHFLQVGLDLHQFDSNQSWKKLGYKSFYQWAEHSDKCPIGHRRAYAAMQVFRLFALKLSLPVDTLAQVGEAKFQVITGAVSKASKQLTEPEAQAVATQWVNRAISMPKRDLSLLVKEEKHKITTLCNRFVLAGELCDADRKLLGLDDVDPTKRVFINIWIQETTADEEPNTEATLGTGSYSVGEEGHNASAPVVATAAGPGELALPVEG